MVSVLIVQVKLWVINSNFSFPLKSSSVEGDFYYTKRPIKKRVNNKLLCPCFDSIVSVEVVKLKYNLYQPGNLNTQQFLKLPYYGAMWDMWTQI